MSGKLQRRAAVVLALAGVLGIVRAADALLHWLRECCP